MLQKTIEIIKVIASRTGEALLFHSATGKDSIALLDIMQPYFKRVVCVFMYSIKGFEHCEKYIRWATNQYNNVEFLQLPHFANSTYIKSGLLGIKKETNIKTYTLKDINDIARFKTGINWTFYGMKQNDGLNRRLMLRGYDMNAICDKTFKVYPLSEWSNKDVLKYIELKGLIKPISYNTDRSSGFEPDNIEYLLFLKEKYPRDLALLISVFPMASQVLFEYEYHKNRKK